MNWLPRQSRFSLAAIAGLALIGMILIAYFGGRGGLHAANLLVTLDAVLVITTLSSWIVAVVVHIEQAQTREEIAKAVADVYRLGMINGAHRVAHADRAGIHLVDGDR